MSCYHPISAFRTPTGVVFSALRRHDILGDIELPCGQCIGCRQRRARDWATRCAHEASQHDQNCFVTLTYSDENLPPDGSLRHRDFQLFMKRLRDKLKLHKPRYYMCGEYGPQTQRPHYHACIFGLDFQDRIPQGRSKSGQVFYSSPTLDSLWQLGHATVQPFNQATAAYTARYVVEKLTGDLGRAAYGTRKPPYNAMSRRPGLGASWLSRYGASDVHPGDYVVSDGVKSGPPKFYDRLRLRSTKTVVGDLVVARDDVQLDAIEETKQARVDKARLHLADQTPERLRVREIVHQAQTRNQTRGNP